MNRLIPALLIFSCLALADDEVYKTTETGWRVPRWSFDWDQAWAVSKPSKCGKARLSVQWYVFEHDGKTWRMPRLLLRDGETYGTVSVRFDQEASQWRMGGNFERADFWRALKAKRAVISRNGKAYEFDLAGIREAAKPIIQAAELEK